MARKTTTTTSKTTRTRKPKALPGRQNGGVGKGGIVTQHGVTTTGYQRGCRCDLCKAAARDYDRKARERKAAAAKMKKPAKVTTTNATARKAKATRVTTDPHPGSTGPRSRAPVPRSGAGVLLSGDASLVVLSDVVPK